MWMLCLLELMIFGVVEGVGILGLVLAQADKWELSRRHPWVAGLQGSYLNTEAFRGREGTAGEILPLLKSMRILPLTSLGPGFHLISCKALYSRSSALQHNYWVSLNLDHGTSDTQTGCVCLKMETCPFFPLPPAACTKGGVGRNQQSKTENYANKMCLN